MANEIRLIDANALIHRLCAERDAVEIKDGCAIGYHNGLNMAVSMAINAPNVDAVSVVRCKDCKHWMHTGDGWGDCTNSRFHLPGHPDPTMHHYEYCALGERKDNGKL